MRIEQRKRERERERERVWNNDEIKTVVSEPEAFAAKRGTRTIKFYFFQIQKIKRSENAERAVSPLEARDQPEVHSFKIYKAVRFPVFITTSSYNSVLPPSFLQTPRSLLSCPDLFLLLD